MRKIWLLGLLTLCLSFFITKNTFAEKSTYQISITPVVERIHLVQNSEAEKKFQVKNESDQELKIKVYAAPYSASGDKDKVNLESETKYTAIHNWISFKGADGIYSDTQFYDLGAKSSAEIKYKIAVPAEVATGGQYAVIFAETIGASESAGIKNQSRVALKIQGVFDELQKFGAEISEIKSSGFLLGGKLGLKTEVKNTGNIDISVGVRASLSSLSGETIFEKDYATSVYPEATKTLEYTFDETPGFGIYKLHALVSAAGEKKEIDKTIIILPAYIIIPVIIVGIVAIYIIYRRISLRRARGARKKAKKL